MPNASFFTQARLGNIIGLVYKDVALRLCIIEPLGGTANMLAATATHEQIIARESILSPRLTNTWLVAGAFDAVDNRWELPQLVFNLAASSAQLDFIQLFLLAGGSANAPKQFTTSAINVSTNEITVPQHGLTTGDRVIITTTGTLPTPLQATTLYVALVVDTTKFKLAQVATPTTEIDITATGSGTFYLKYANGVVDRIINNLSSGSSPVPVLESIPVGAQKTYEVLLGLGQG